MTEYAEKITKLTVDIETLEKNPDDFNEADFEDVKVQIKQAEALIIELQLSVNASVLVFESLHVQVSHHHYTHQVPWEIIEIFD